MTSSTSWFTSEIQQMMFGFGDSRRPLHETAVLVEEIVHQQMVAMIYKVWDVVTARGEKNISIEDVLFLLRKDKTKLRRLLRYYEVRDLKNSVKSTLNSGEEGKKMEFTLSQLGERKGMGKNLQACYQFLSSIDQTGELMSLFDDKDVDVVKHERMVRAELQSQGMDTQAYMDFCKARQANFSQRYTKSQRFRDWLVVDIDSDIVLSANAVELFSYLAYETVAQIVDLALLVKQDRRATPGDPMSRFRPALCVTYSQLQAGSMLGKADSSSPASSGLSPPTDSGASQATSAGQSSVVSSTTWSGSKKKRKRSGPATSMDQSWDASILPADVQEALRRYHSDISPLASSMKMNASNSPWHKPMCC